MRNRSRLSLLCTIIWLVLLPFLAAALNPGWLGAIGLMALAVVVGGLLWNLDAIASAWREDREAKRTG